MVNRSTVNRAASPTRSTDLAQDQPCGSCQSCILTSNLSEAAHWLLPAQDDTKLCFLSGLLLRCHSFNILQAIRQVLLVTLGSNVTPPKGSFLANPSAWSCSQAVLGDKMSRAWSWFRGSRYWVKTNYILGLLSVCSSDVLHVLSNLLCVLIKETREAQYNPTAGHSDDYSDLSHFIREKVLAAGSGLKVSKGREVSLEAASFHQLSEDAQLDVLEKWILQNQADIPKGSLSTRANPVYATIREVLVPEIEEETPMLHSDVVSSCEHIIKLESAFVSAYKDVKTRAVEMEERNVCCGVYTLLTLADQDDPSRVVDYRGGQWVALGAKDRQVCLLNVATGKQVMPAMRGHAGSVQAVLLCEERGLVVSASYDLTIRCWSLRTGVCTMLLRGHMGTINCLDVHGNRLVSGAKDCRVKVWNLLTGRCYRKMKFRHKHPVKCVKIDKKRILSSCQKGLVKLWCMQSATLLKLIDVHKGAVKCLFFDECHILSGGVDGYVRAWSTSCNFRKCLMTFRHPGEVQTLALSYLRVITGCTDGKIRIFNFITGDCLRVIMHNRQQNPVISLHMHKKNIVINSRSQVTLLRFAKVLWDYTLPPECEFIPVSKPDIPKDFDLRSHPYPCLWAERMARLNVSKRKVFSHTRNSVVSPHNQSMEEAKGAKLQHSEKAFLKRVRQRGPHHPITEECLLLRVNTFQQHLSSSEAARNMEINARLRDSWSSPSLSSPVTEMCSTLKQNMELKPSMPFQNLTWTYSPVTQCQTAPEHQTQLRPCSILRAQRMQRWGGLLKPRVYRVSALTTTAEPGLGPSQRMLMRPYSNP